MMAVEAVVKNLQSMSKQLTTPKEIAQVRWSTPLNQETPVRVPHQTITKLNALEYVQPSLTN